MSPVRPVGHDIIDFNGAQNNDGADECIDFVDRVNLGLKECRPQSTTESDSVNGLPETCEASGCPRRDFAGFLVRWLGHGIIDFNGAQNNDGRRPP